MKLITLLFALAVLAVAPASALATVTWSDTADGVVLSGTITVKLNGANPKTCTFPSTSGTFASGAAAMDSYQYRLACGGTNFLYWAPNMLPYHDASGYGLDVVNDNDWFGNPLDDPWGGSWVSYTDDFKAPFTNGSGSTQSTFTLSNTWIGAGYDGPQGDITATGTVTIKTGNGGLLTLSGT